MTDDAPMREIRGTLILCDQVYRTDQGKWVIAGTYSHWQTVNDELTLHSLNAYIRLQFERPGTYPLRLTMHDRGQSPNAAPMMEARAQITIGDAQLPIFEMGIQLPELRIAAPVKFKDRPPGSRQALRTLLWLKVQEIDVASCHLDFIFVGPPPS